jgi:magnesium chelatase family protein
MRYQKRISGPLLDRIDIHIEVPSVDYEKLADKRNVEDSKTTCARVQTVRERQLERIKGTKMKMV